MRTPKSSTLIRIIMFTVAGFTLAGAPGCDNQVDTTPNFLPQISDVVEGVIDVSGEECGCMAIGDWYRFTALDVTALSGPDTMVLRNVLTTLWKADIDCGELNILLEITDVTHTEVTARGVNGVRIENGSETCEETAICFAPETEVEIVFPRDGCLLEPSAETGFNVMVGSDVHPKTCTTTLPVQHAIPVAKAVLTGTMNPDCSSIFGGELVQGMLGKAVLESICTCIQPEGYLSSECGDLDPAYEDELCPGCNSGYMNMGILLPNYAPEGLDWSYELEDGSEAASLSATWDAVKLDEAPPACQ